MGNIAAVAAAVGAITARQAVQTAPTPGYKKLCSNHCCNNVATQLEPRHLCASCVRDPKLNGPEPVFVKEK